MLALDADNDPDVLSINAASAALTVSDIPWSGPVGAVRVGYLDRKIMINPTKRDMENSLVDLVVVGTKDAKVVMLEGQCKDLDINSFRNIVSESLVYTREIALAIERLGKTCGKLKRPHSEDGTSSVDKTVGLAAEFELKRLFMDFSHDKNSRDRALNEIRDRICSNITEYYSNSDTPAVSRHDIIASFNRLQRSVFRKLILTEGQRCDGRDSTQLRDISCQVDLFKPLHGSALFQRGQTQVMCTLAYDSPESAMKIDPLSNTLDKNFMLHYEFPPFATNEVSELTRVGRREIGHGILAERAVSPVIPLNNPFTTRLLCEVLESNGSSSMASVCAASLALMDAGVQISNPVSGVAVGLVKEGDDFTVLTDIQGIEDHLGDMDFKIAGTKTGITAVQLDVKIPGISSRILMQAINQGFTAKREILNIMALTMAQPRRERKTNAPISDIIEVTMGKRAKFVGVAGANLKKVSSLTGVTIIPLDELRFEVFAPNPSSMSEAKLRFQQLLDDIELPEFEFGTILPARIVEMKDLGVMVELHPSMNPVLLPNSQIGAILEITRGGTHTFHFTT